MINSWSHSRIVDFEKCKFSAYLKYDQRIPEPPRPLPPGKTEHANDRGTRIHEDAENFVRGTLSTLPYEARHFSHEFEALKKLYDLGMVSLEGEWGYDQDWAPAEWKTAWLRMKLDGLVFLNPYEAVAIDYKSGKKFGNEIKHGEQLMLYQLATFLRYPELEVVHTELWYLDQNDLTLRTFTRDQGLRFRKAWDKRGRSITEATEFPPNANVHSCRYCPYGDPANGFTNGTGHCKAGRK